MKAVQSYEIICGYMPHRLKRALSCIEEKFICKVSEIRIRCNRPVALHFNECSRYLCTDGTLTDCQLDREIIYAEKTELNDIFNALCRFSIHSSHRELSQGFFTIENGIRVGISGSVSQSSEKIFRYISGFNFRISREIIGCSELIYQGILSSGLKSILVCGGVNTGKTTILRDLCRICGNRYKVTLIDERNEISAAVDGISTNDVGVQTDIIEGSSRATGITSAIRSLSPQVIFCDEIGCYDDAAAIITGFGCGVKFIASVHAENFDDLSRRVFLKEILSYGVFDYAVFLEGTFSPGKIREIRRLK